ncbi:Magnesium transporting ATPase, P-type 1 [Salmonella enterica subsp. arizonae]|uniref:Magnesium transporting ATPase, P-type 1 n=1 Tax=Salmonella enterica subsp. arizonae TaxID=59203 RepID=A0A379T473_SALER|nr:Magnesium transporting ATPase, P-type 1 [Salmonella enterica subsp. arizonae]
MSNCPDKDKSLLDLGNICLMGTNVTSGRAQAVVVATGNRTWFGSPGEVDCRHTYPDGF